jgi:hypothetical protein
MSLGGAHLDDPPAVSALSGEMQLQLESATMGGKRGVERAACVHHEGVALSEKGTDLVESRMGDLWTGSPRDQETHAVAVDPMRFGRLTCLQLRRQVKVERRRCATRVKPLESWYSLCLERRLRCLRFVHN